MATEQEKTTTVYIHWINEYQHWDEAKQRKQAAPYIIKVQLTPPKTKLVFDATHDDLFTSMSSSSRERKKNTGWSKCVFLGDIKAGASVFVVVQHEVGGGQSYIDDRCGSIHFNREEAMNEVLDLFENEHNRPDADFPCEVCASDNEEEEEDSQHEQKITDKQSRDKCKSRECNLDVCTCWKKVVGNLEQNKTAEFGSSGNSEGFYVNLYEITVQK
jgi:hypothetical protein